MNGSARVVALTAAIFALAAVVLAALGSHFIDMRGLQTSWESASKMHMFSTATLLGLAALLARLPSFLLKWGAGLVIAGTVAFSGSIYLHIMTGYKLALVTPAGGLLMMLGWCLVILALLRRS